MNAELVLLGKRVDMSRRTRRRGLVAGVYLALAVLIAVLWWRTGWHGTGVWLIWAVMLACRFFLGGHYRGGLIKPFVYRKPMNAEAPPSLLALKLRVYQPVLQADDDGFRNDERELNQRDRAHYLAYQTIGMMLMIELLVASMRMLNPRLQAWMGMPADRMYYGVTLVTLTLFLTLPQAILLWTEPDMEAAGVGYNGPRSWNGDEKSAADAKRLFMAVGERVVPGGFEVPTEFVPVRGPEHEIEGGFAGEGVGAFAVLARVLPFRADAGHELGLARKRPGLFEEQVGIPLGRAGAEERGDASLELKPVLNGREFDGEVGTEAAGTVVEAARVGGAELEDCRGLFFGGLRRNRQCSQQEQHERSGGGEAHGHHKRRLKPLCLRRRSCPAYRGPAFFLLTMRRQSCLNRATLHFHNGRRPA
jgi:uncharacterized membrane protein YkgB